MLLLPKDTIIDNAKSSNDVVKCEAAHFQPYVVPGCRALQCFGQHDVEFQVFPSSK